MPAELEKVVSSTARVKTETDLRLAEKAVQLAQLQLTHRKMELELIKRLIQLEKFQESSQNTKSITAKEKERALSVPFVI